jgi:hypothetical protein
MNPFNSILNYIPYIKKDKDDSVLDEAQRFKRQRNNIYTKRSREKKREYVERVLEEVRKGKAENRVLLQRLMVLQSQLQQRKEVGWRVMKRISQLEGKLQS